MEAARNTMLANINFPNNIRFRTSQEGEALLHGRRPVDTVLKIMRIVITMQAFEHDWALRNLDKSNPLYAKKVQELRASEIAHDQALIARDRVQPKVGLGIGTGIAATLILGGLVLATAGAAAPLIVGAVGGGIGEAVYTGFIYKLESRDIDRAVKLWQKDSDLRYTAALHTVLVQQNK